MISPEFGSEPALPEEVQLLELLAGGLVESKPATIHASYEAARTEDTRLQFIIESYEDDPEGNRLTGAAQITDVANRVLFGIQFDHASMHFGDSDCKEPWRVIELNQQLLAELYDPEEKAIVRHMENFLFARAAGQTLDESGIIKDATIGRHGALELIHGRVAQKSPRSIHTRSNRIPLDRNFEVSISSHQYYPERADDNEPVLQIKMTKGPLHIVYAKLVDGSRLLRPLNMEKPRELADATLQAPEIVSRQAIRTLLRCVDHLIEFEADVPESLENMSE